MAPSAAVIHKDVLSQADILVAMKLTSSQDRDATGGWIEGQADRIEGKRILSELPRLSRGEGYLWAPGHDGLSRVSFPVISTFDSSHTPRRGERVGTPRTLAEVDLSTITAALAGAVSSVEPTGAPGLRRLRQDAPGRRRPEQDQEFVRARARIAELETALAEAQQGRANLHERLVHIGQLATQEVPVETEGAAGGMAMAVGASSSSSSPPATATGEDAHRAKVTRLKHAAPAPDDELHAAARKLLAALARHAPARFTWGQAAMLAGLKSTGGHYNAGRRQLRDRCLVDEAGDQVAASTSGLDAAGEVPPAPSTPAERLSLWCERLPSPAPEMLRALAVSGEFHTSVEDLAIRLGKKPTGGHWNSGIAVLRNNGLVEIDGKRLRVSELFR